MNLKIKTTYTCFFACVILFGALGSGVFAQTDETKLSQLSLQSEDDTQASANSKSNMIDVLKFEDMEIRDVFKVITKKTYLNFIIDQDVTANVTMFLNDIDVYEAIRIILEASNLAYIEDNGVIRVMTEENFKKLKGYPFRRMVETKTIPVVYASTDGLTDVLMEMKSETGKVILNKDTQTFILIDTPDKIASMEKYLAKVDLPIETEEIRLKFVKGEKIIRDITDLSTDGVGRIQFDAQKNSLIITDTSLKIQEIKKQIQSLDKDEEKVELKIKILQIILSDEHFEGVDWEAIVSNYQSVEFLGLKNVIEASNDGRISLGTVNEEDFTILLDALDTVGQIKEIYDKTLSSKINTGSLIEVKSLDEITLEENDKDVDLSRKDEDFKLYLTPRIAQDGMIDLYIEPEVFSLAEQSASVASQSGSTIIVGGLFKDIMVQVERKIPLLSDIPIIRDVPLGELPILGFPFRGQRNRERKTEIIVFITPHIVSND